MTTFSPSSERPPGTARRALLLAVGTACVYLLIAGRFQFHFVQTWFSHHILMADALLHGRLDMRPAALDWKARALAEDIAAHLDEAARAQGVNLAPVERSEAIIRNVRPIAQHDWAFTADGRIYGYWGLTTPLLVAPFVALFGLGVSDQFLTAIYGAACVGLFYWLLRRLDRARLFVMDESCRLGLTVFLAFGTSLFWQACAGQVWFAVQISTLLFVLLAMIAACGPADRRRDALLAGAFFGLAMLARGIVILIGLFFLIVFLLRARRAAADSSPDGRGGWSRTLRVFMPRAVLFGLPILAALGVQGWYNYARFGDVRNSGLELQIYSGGNPGLLRKYQQHGLLSPHYLRTNAYYYFLCANFPRGNDGLRYHDLEGNSLFLVMPPMLYLFLAWRRARAFALALLAGIVPLLVVLMLYFNTGFSQFGPRYLLDAMPLLILLAGIGMRGRLTHVSYVLIVLAIAAHIFGTSRVCAEEFGVRARYVTEFALAAFVAAAIAARAAWAWHCARRPVSPRGPVAAAPGRK